MVIRRGEELKTIVSDEYLGGFVWSPNGKSLAISKIGKLVFYDLESGAQQSVSLTDIYPELGGHIAHFVNWNPEGDAVACCVVMLGARFAGSHMAGDDEVFIIPRKGKPHTFSVNAKESSDDAGSADRHTSLRLVMDLQWRRVAAAGDGKR